MFVGSSPNRPDVYAPYSFRIANTASILCVTALCMGRVKIPVKLSSPQETTVPRPAAPSSIDEIINTAVAGVIANVAPRIAKAIADAAAVRVEQELRIRGPKKRPSRRARLRSAELTKWVADRRARRVPKFVIAVTGLNTKKLIVAKYGPNASFEKGRPAPKPNAA